MREYEIMVVLQPEVEEDGIESVIERFTERLSEDGGEVTYTGTLADRKGNLTEVEDTWNTRRFAYPIKGHTEGYYIVLQFDSPPESIDDLEQQLRLNEDVLRYLTIRQDQ